MPSRRAPRAWFPGVALAVLGACAEEDASGPAAPAAEVQTPVHAASAPQGQSAPGSLPPAKRLAGKYEKLDASVDGWDSEVFNDRAGKALKEIAVRLETPGALAGDPPAILAEGFACERLRPEELATAFDGAGLTIRRAELAQERPPEPAHRGGQGLLAALRELRAPFDADAKLSMELLKIVSVDLEEGVVGTSIFYRLKGSAQGGLLQEDAEWTCSWEPQQGEALPRLSSIRVLRYEESHARSGVLLADCSEAVLGANASWREQMLPHLDSWLNGMPARLYEDYYGHRGLALGDADGDGLEDVYVCQAGGLPNRLYLQKKDGTVEDASARAGVDFLEPTHGALFIDLDNDGDQDLFLSMGGAVVALENAGPARFTVRWFAPRMQVRSLAAADPDADGDLDVYCCVYKIPDAEGAAPIPYHDANNGNPNVLWRNEGHWRFSDITVECGLDENNRRYSFAACWEDYDNDGDQDLYVANDFGRNNLYRNDGGRFDDVAAEAGVEDISAGMSADWGDYDNDGWMDVYVGNMFSGAGNRIAYQRRFQAANDAGTRSLYQRHAKGNSLFRNAGDGTFWDVSQPAGVTMALWAWSSPFVELNNDGLVDLFVANGFITSEDSKDL